jgi:hypothetical protein
MARLGGRVSQTCKAWTIAGAVFLVSEVGLAGFGVLIHYGLTAEYGNINESAFEGLMSGFTMGVGGIALFVVVAVAGMVCLPHRCADAMGSGAPAGRHGRRHARCHPEGAGAEAQ